MLLNPYTQTIFLKSAAKTSQLPDDIGYEVAFAGRSNAGKSSALNTLTSRRQLARTSKTPGRTQLINVFVLPDPSRRLVDLPGYGYAKVSQPIKQNWHIHLADYLETRQSLKGLILLMDIRHPLKESDTAMIHWAFKRTLPIHILLTKADKLSKQQAQRTVHQVKEYYKNSPAEVTVQPFSSLKKEGVETLITIMNKWLEIRDHS